MHIITNSFLNVVFILALAQVISSATLYECVSQSFQTGCKTQLYACTDNSQCSYQLNENTQHAFLTPTSKQFPPVYFSNPLAIKLYECLKKNCNLPELDASYLSTLTKDLCMIEVYSICGGDIDMIYKSGKELDSKEKQCYKKYCYWEAKENNFN